MYQNEWHIMLQTYLSQPEGDEGL